MSSFFREIFLYLYLEKKKKSNIIKIKNSQKNQMKKQFSKKVALAAVSAVLVITACNK